MTDIERSKYNNEREIARKDVAHKLRSTGRTGLSEILRLSLAIFTHDHRPEDPHNIRGDKGIEDMFRSLFRREGLEHESRDVFQSVDKTYSSPVARQLISSASMEEFTDVGGLNWNHCAISTPSSRLEYSGPNLFRDYAKSVALPYLEHGEIIMAREIFAKAALKERRSADGWEDLLQLCRFEGNYDVALDVAERCVASCPNFEEQAWVRLMDVYVELDDLEGAIKRFKLALDESQFKCLWALSLAYERNGDPMKAAETLEKAINLAPTAAIASKYRRPLAKLYQQFNNERAVQVLRQQLAAPDTRLSERRRVWKDLGNIYRRIGRFDEAVAAYEISISIKYVKHTFSGIVKTYTENADYDGAIERIKSEIIEQPDDEYLRSLLGESYEKRGNHDAAVEVYEATINEWVHDGRDPTIFWKRLGGMKALIGDLKGAKHAYEMALDCDPSDKDCWRFLASTFEELGDYVGADEVHSRGEARVDTYWNSDSERSEFDDSASEWEWCTDRSFED